METQFSKINEFCEPHTSLFFSSSFSINTGDLIIIIFFLVVYVFGKRYYTALIQPQFSSKLQEFFFLRLIYGTTVNNEIHFKYVFV